MPSLAELPLLVGFFSYSRQDDEDSGGKLSKLRERIQAELRGQLGRAKTDFKLWQDKDAIAHGELWEERIRAAVGESVFFIPIITPTAVRSDHCKFEFDSFLAREKDLGRNNLIFPILYIPIPALTDGRWHQDALLKIIGSRQYEDWQNFRHHDPSSTEFALRIEKFCANISKAMHQPWLSTQERQENEARQREEEERHRKLQQAEARQREEEERGRKEEQRQEEQRRNRSQESPPGASADSESVKQAQSFLRGEDLQFDIANALWKRLKTEDQLSLARRVLQRMHTKPERVIGGVPNNAKDTLWEQEALLTSKDPELPAVTRHDDALKLLTERFDYIGDEASTVGGKSYERGDTLGIAGGICRRRWYDLGRLEDLLLAAAFYRRGAECNMGSDAYPHINAAFVEDQLAQAGDEPEKCRARAAALRKRILEELAPENSNWWNVATRAEAWFGLKKYAEATQVVAQFQGGPGREPWQLRTMAEQLAQLAHLHEERPLEVENIRTFFATLLPGAEDAISALIIGKVGLALSGGGFRASYYHLGVLACLAERDVLRNLEVLSCVSGGSIVGACYWLKLRERMLRPEPLKRDDYIKLVEELIAHFHTAVQKNVRAQVQPYIVAIAWRLLRGQKGVLDPESTAVALEEQFYQPLWPDQGPILMDQLVFQPPDHDPVLTGSQSFNPAKHNWLRTHKVPALILNATTVNTGHAWHFTTTWMGESPWATHAAADSVPRLQWSMYDPNSGWRIRLGRAVAASACVPTVFAPLHLGKYYKQENKDVDVTLVDGGVHDNQGTVSLLASDCNVILVSDACGQLMLEHTPPTGFSGLVRSTLRPSDTLMERVRLANFADLDARRRSGRLRGLMFLHMKAGLDADMLRLNFVRDAYDLQREPLSPSGVSKDFQQALAELRTDLDAFAADEAHGLMACGYQMASKALNEQLPKMRKVWKKGADANWVFKAFLDDITSTANTTGRRAQRLAALQAGNKVDFLRS